MSVSAEGGHLTTVESFFGCANCRRPGCLGVSASVHRVSGGGARNQRVGCLSIGTVRRFLGDFSGASRGRLQYFYVILLLCRDNTEIARLYGIHECSLRLRGPCAVVLRKGKSGVESIPLSKLMTSIVDGCVRGCEMSSGSFLFFGAEERELAERNMGCVIRGCFRETELGRTSVCPTTVSTRYLHRAGTVRLLRGKMGLVCVESLLNRASIAAARVCSGTGPRMGEGRVRSTSQVQSVDLSCSARRGRRLLR